jgi:hypothetical protein
MMIAYQNRQMFDRPTGWEKGELVASSNPGYSRIHKANGQTLCMEEGGVYGERPPDQDGGWEQCKRSGNVCAYQHGDEVYGVVIMEV